MNLSAIPLSPGSDYIRRQFQIQVRVGIVLNPANLHATAQGFQGYAASGCIELVMRFSVSILLAVMGIHRGIVTASLTLRRYDDIENIQSPPKSLIGTVNVSKRSGSSFGSLPHRQRID